MSHRRATLLALGLTAASVAAGTGAVLAVAEELPDPVATHWGTSGADGFMSLPGALLTTAAILAGTVLLLLGTAAVVPGSPRSLVATAAGTAVGMAVMIYGSLVLQAGLADAADAADPWPLMLAGGAVGLGVGLLVARLTPPAAAA